MALSTPTLFNSGTFMPLGISYVQETTVFREYGPLAGNTVRIAYDYAPSWGNMMSRQTADIDARYYLRLATNGVLQGLALIYSGGTPAGFSSPMLRWFMTARIGGTTPVVFFVAAFAVFDVGDYSSITLLRLVVAPLFAHVTFAS